MTQMEFDSFDEPPKEGGTEVGTDEREAPEDFGKLKITAILALLLALVVSGVLYFLLNMNSTQTETEKVEETETVIVDEESKEGVTKQPSQENKTAESQVPQATLPETPAQGWVELDSDSEYGNSADFEAIVTDKSRGTLDGKVSLYRVDFVVLEKGLPSDTGLYTFLTKSSWDSVEVGSKLTVTLQKDSGSRFVVQRVAVL